MITSSHYGSVPTGVPYVPPRSSFASYGLTGPDFFGFGLPEVKCVLETLPGAAAAQIVLPVCVEVIDPGGKVFIHSELPITAESGIPELIPLPQTSMSAFTP